GGMRDVQAAGAVTFFTADVPLGDLVGGDVVVDGVAAVAEGAGGALHVGAGIEGLPPVGALFDVVGEPAFFLDVPLGGEDVVVVADFGEVALLVTAAVDEGDLVEGEGDERVGFGEIAEDGVGVLPGRADDVGHAGLLPAVVLRGVAGSAGSGADEVRGGCLRRGSLRGDVKSEGEKGQRQGEAEAVEHDGGEYRMRASDELSRRDDGVETRTCECIEEREKRLGNEAEGDEEDVALEVDGAEFEDESVDAE